MMGARAPVLHSWRRHGPQEGGKGQWLWPTMSRDLMFAQIR